MAGEVMERFWSKVDRAGPPPDFRPDLGPCWVWTDRLERKGYGRFHVRCVGGRNVRKMAHVFAYEHLVGPVPAGLQLDHLCRVRACVNPAHLEPVTPAENRRRGFASILNKNNHQVTKTHCPRGHPYAGDNLYTSPKGDRRCRTCHRERMRRAV